MGCIFTSKGLPAFERITPKEIENHLPPLLKELNEELITLENNIRRKLNKNDSLTWNELIGTLHKIEKKLHSGWGVVSHLYGVSNSPELREVYSSQQPKVIRFCNRLGQSTILFDALTKLLQDKKQQLDETQQRIIRAELLEMKNKGVGLTGDEKELFNYNSERLAKLSTTFSDNVLDASNSWKLLLTKQEEIAGLPRRNRELMAKAAKNNSDPSSKEKYKYTADQGPWLLTLDVPSYIAFITYSENRNLREKIYKAYVSRASKGTKNNEILIEEILDLRSKQSKLLGYQNWAELSLANKMAQDINEVESLLEEIRVAAMPAAHKEIKRLQDFASKNTNKEFNDFAPWDLSFWSEKLRQDILDLNQEELRAWFPLSQVLNGLFKLCERLFDIYIEPENKSYPVWHKDVQLFNVIDNKGAKIASFYLDPYSRPETKRGGAWMDECLTKEKLQDGNYIVPVAYLICNQTPPMNNTPSLMSFEEVRTLFHEFGHGLQHMLTTIDYPKAAGINNIEWDAVELPSQFMENWCLDNRTIHDIAKHWETKESLSDEDVNKLRLNQIFNSGISTMRQIHFALTDIKLHSSWEKESGIKPNDLRRDLAKSTCVLQPIPEDNFLCAFNHIFAGGYSAGYYSYKWAEVLSADAYASFEESGLDNELEIRKKGTLFRDTVLSLGGSKSPAEVFKLFRGRSPSTKPLIRHSGLISNS